MLLNFENFCLLEVGLGLILPLSKFYRQRIGECGFKLCFYCLGDGCMLNLVHSLFPFPRNERVNLLFVVYITW